MTYTPVPAQTSPLVTLMMTNTTHDPLQGIRAAFFGVKTARRHKKEDKTNKQTGQYRNVVLSCVPSCTLWSGLISCLFFWQLYARCTLHTHTHLTGAARTPDFIYLLNLFTCGGGGNKSRRFWIWFRAVPDDKARWERAKTRRPQ